MSSTPQSPAAKGSQSSGIPRVLVATTALLSFISFWRAAAIVLNDLASSAYYAGGEAEGYIGKAAQSCWSHCFRSLLAMRFQLQRSQACWLPPATSFRTASCGPVRLFCCLDGPRTIGATAIAIGFASACRSGFGVWASGHS